jgi:hypothetical protein
MLTRLPEVLSIDILSNWCDLQTVAKVNSAFCNKVNRSDFLCLLSDPKFASTDSSYQSSMEFREWIESKGIKLQYLSCEHMSSKLLTNADCSKAHEAALTVCQFHHNSSEDTLDAFLPLISNQILSGLVDFTILGCPYDLTNISIFCKELRSFSLLRCRSGIPYFMLVQIIRNNRHLQNLTVKGCLCKTDFIKAIALNFVELQSLTIFWCLYG